LEEEVSELKDALESYATAPHKVCEEAADVANFAMMLADKAVDLYGVGRAALEASHD